MKEDNHRKNAAELAEAPGVQSKKNDMEKFIPTYFSQFLGVEFEDLCCTG